MKRINHQEAYSLDAACTNIPEEYFSPCIALKIGIHHQIYGAYLLRYVQALSWREDNRRVSMAIRRAALQNCQGESVDLKETVPSGRR